MDGKEFKRSTASEIASELFDKEIACAMEPADVYQALACGVVEMKVATFELDVPEDPDEAAIYAYKLGYKAQLKDATAPDMFRYGEITKLYESYLLGKIVKAQSEQV